MKKRYLYLELDEENEVFFEIIRNEIGKSINEVSIHETKKALIEQLQGEFE